MKLYPKIIPAIARDVIASLMTDDERRLPLVAIGDVRGKTIRAQLVSVPGLRRAAKK